MVTGRVTRARSTVDQWYVAFLAPLGSAAKTGSPVSAASVAVWLMTAVLGANLLFRSGAFRGGPNGRSARRRALLAIHVFTACSALVVWIWFVITPTPALGLASVLLLLVAAFHGLLMVLRWAPGFGRHALRGPPVRRHGGYFPVHAAAIHAVAAGSTVTLVLLVLVRFFAT